MYALRIPGHIEGLTQSPDPTGTKEQIARQLLFPNPESDVNGIRKLPRGADVILEQTQIITIGRVERTEVMQVGRWSVGQLLPPKFLGSLF